MRVKLVDIAGVIRSKNAGPGKLTLDIIFKSAEWFEKVVASGEIDKALMGRLYGCEAEAIDSIIAFAPAWAIKITLARKIVSGDVGDSDIYGAQQHAPLMGLVLEKIS